MNYQRLSELRKYNDWSQSVVADKVGVSRSVYAAYELGIRIIPLKHLYVLAKIYNVPIDYLVNLTDHDEEVDIYNISELNKEEIGNKIKEIRQEFHLTLRNLASVLNTTSSTISAYETGKTLILTAFAVQICQKYHISLDWLCGRTEHKYLNK